MLTIAGGNVVMRDGQVTGSGSRVLATAEGAAAIRNAGCTPVAYDPAASGLHRGVEQPAT